MIRIAGIHIATPGQRTAIRDLPEYAELQGPEKEYYETCGVEHLYEAADRGPFDLALEASQQLLAAHGLDGTDIDVIIYIRPRLPEAMISSQALHLRSELGADKALTLGMGDLGCADSTMALRMAQDMLMGNRRLRKALIAYGHQKYAPRRFRYPVTLQGDGGMAVLVEKSEGPGQVLDMRFDFNGKYWDLFQVDYRQSAYEDYREVCSDPRKYGFELAIESKNRFTELNEGILADNGLSKQDVAAFLLQNISNRAYEYYNDALGIRIHPICAHNLAEYGHLGCADVFHNYKSLTDSGMLHAGQKVLMMNNSPVAAWSSILIKV